MNIRGQVQGFAIGAAVMAAVMVGFPASTSAPVATNPYATIAAEFNVTIQWQTVGLCGPGTTGCFDPTTPNVIYVKTGMDANETRYVVLHEIGHASQYRMGLPLDECNADEFARSLGGYRDVGRDC